MAEPSGDEETTGRRAMGVEGRQGGVLPVGTPGEGPARASLARRALDLYSEGMWSGCREVDLAQVPHLSEKQEEHW